MKILFIASEAVPLAKVGGLADVTGALPKALRELGHDARILIPQYNNIPSQFELKSEIRDFKIDFLSSSQAISINQTLAGEIPVYTLDSPFYFGTPEIYVNELERFYFFSKAVHAVLPYLKWQPEIIHCHDWMTALIILWAKKYDYPYHSVFTIHNLNFQGNFDGHLAINRELQADWKYCPAGAPSAPSCYMGQAILWADQINTVSETYAREITTPEFGVGLDGLLRFRQEHLCGILNGIDNEVWNPSNDGCIEQKFDSETLSTKTDNKVALQKYCGLPVDSEAPLVGMVQRLDEQKGLDIFLEGVDKFLDRTNVQIVIQGTGRQDYQAKLQQIALAHPRQVAAIMVFEEALAHRVYASCDLFLMPSRFEPCGLGQMIAMRYGAIPVVRHTGGLVDSVPEFSSDLIEGSGFVFHEYSAEALFGTLEKALDAYYNRKLWTLARERVSRIDLSWQQSARQYEKLYSSLLKASPLTANPQLGPGSFQNMARA
jgi:starch synthase